MSDQQQASGDSSTPGAAAATPDAEAVAAQLAGTGKPRTASAAKGTETGKAAGSEPGSGTDTGDGPAPATGPDTGRDTDEETTRPARPAGAPASAAGNTGGAADGAGLDGAEGAEVTDGADGADGSGKASAGEKAEAAGERSEGTADKNGARALSAAAAGGHPQALATAVAGNGATGATRSAVGRPRKPVLAGAALAGAVLVAVPLLITALGRDEEKDTVDNAAADTVLNEVNGPAGVFATQTPSPSRTAPKKEKKQRAQSVAPPAEKPAAAPAPDPSPSPSKPAPKKKAVVKKAPSTLPAVLTRVLIKNNTNHTCVDVPGFASGRQDGPVTHATCNSNTDDNQLWNVEQRYDKAGPGGVPLFQIRNVMDGMCLDLPGYQGVGGATKVTEFPCEGSTKDNQLWWLDKQSDGKFWIRNAASNNQCLDSYGNDDQTRSLIIWPCAPEGQNNHEWIFTRS